MVPDILVLGKALGGGAVPVAALHRAGPSSTCSASYALGHYTHEKNPLLARAALTTLAIIEDEQLVANAARVGAYALARLEALKAEHALIGDVRGIGLLLGVELVKDRTTKEPASAEADAVLYRCLERGLSFKTTFGNVLTLTPPLTVTEAEIDRALAILDAAIGETEQAPPSGRLGPILPAAAGRGRRPRRGRRGAVARPAAPRPRSQASAAAPAQIAQLQQARPVRIDLARRIERGEHRAAVDQVPAVAGEPAGGRAEPAQAASGRAGGAPPAAPARRRAAGRRRSPPSGCGCRARSSAARRPCPD